MLAIMKYQSLFKRNCVYLATLIFTAQNTPMDEDVSCLCHHKTTIIISLAGGLSILFILLIAFVITAICIFARSKKKPQRESNDYDTINVGHSPPVIETELNIAYGQPKMLK